MTPALMKDNLFNLVNEFHRVTSTNKCSQCLYGWTHTHVTGKPGLCVAKKNIVVREKVAHHIQIPLSGHGSGRIGFLVQGEKDRAASAAAQGSRALEQTGTSQMKLLPDTTTCYHVATLLFRSQQRTQVYSFNNI